MTGDFIDVTHLFNLKDDKCINKISEEEAETICHSWQQVSKNHMLKVLCIQEAAEVNRLKEINNVKFGQGKSAYSTGQYLASMVLFQEALEKEGEMSALGGEIQLWLALAYQVQFLPITIFGTRMLPVSRPVLPAIPWRWMLQTLKRAVVLENSNLGLGRVFKAS